MKIFFTLSFLLVFGTFLFFDNVVEEKEFVRIEVTPTPKNQKIITKSFKSSELIKKIKKEGDYESGSTRPNIASALIQKEIRNESEKGLPKHALVEDVETYKAELHRHNSNLGMSKLEEIKFKQLNRIPSHEKFPPHLMAYPRAEEQMAHDKHNYSKGSVPKGEDHND